MNRKGLIIRLGLFLLVVVVLILGTIVEEPISDTVVDVPTSDTVEEELPNCPDCNVILIVIDTLRADHLPCYGHRINTAPNICSFAEKSFLFENMFSSSPTTKPSVASIFTSMYSSQHKSVYNEDILNDDLITMAEILNERGYSSYAINSNRVINRKFNYNQGFDSWIDLGDDTGYDASDVNKILFDELENYEKPFFIYLHYIDPHNDYMAPEPYYKLFNGNYSGNVTGLIPYNISYFEDRPDELEQLELFYDNEIAFVDHEIGKLFDTLKKNDLYDSSVIILTSDHGEMFLEHGLLLHANGLYSEVIDVPLIIKIPGYTKNITVDRYVQNIDILPTLVDILDINVSHKFMGDPIFSIIDEPNRPIFSEHLRLTYDNPQKSLIIGKYKLIEDLTNGKHLLFDLDNDASEQKNIINSSSDSDKIIEKMDLLIRKYNTSVQNIERITIDLDDETLEELKLLGYMN